MSRLPTTDLGPQRPALLGTLWKTCEGMPLVFSGPTPRGRKRWGTQKSRMSLNTLRRHPSATPFYGHPVQGGADTVSDTVHTTCTADMKDARGLRDAALNVLCNAAMPARVPRCVLAAQMKPGSKVAPLSLDVPSSAHGPCVSVALGVFNRGPVVSDRQCCRI